MAESKNNAVTKGASGKFADIMVFSQRYGRTFLGKVPVNTSKPSTDQLAVREKFLKAVKYARFSLQDQSIKPLYAQRAGGGTTAFNLAIADFFSAPVVNEINASGYAGAAGDKIIVQATDDTKVTEVKLRIEAADGSLLEEGAVVQDGESENWRYTATVANPAMPGSKLIAEAKDLPGNLVTLEKLL
jgi:hypothetical protein